MKKIFWYINLGVGLFGIISFFIFQTGATFGVGAILLIICWATYAKVFNRPVKDESIPPDISDRYEKK